MMTPVKLTNYRQGKYEVLNMQLYIYVCKKNTMRCMLLRIIKYRVTNNAFRSICDYGYIY
jgi:hypothetical protein